jgi:hypothetical protein
MSGTSNEKQDRLPTVEEFRTACSRIARWAVVLIVTTLAVTFACFAALLPIRDQVRGAYERLLGAAAADTLIGLTPLPGLLVMFVGIWLLHRPKKASCLACPHCGRSLIASQQIVIATRNCCQCGRRVLEEPGPT